MQLDELKKNMTFLEQVLARTGSEIRIDVEASRSAQAKILKKYRQAFMSAAILAAVFGLLWAGGIDSMKLSAGIRAYLEVYLVIASVWYAFLYWRLRGVSIATLKPADLYARVSRIRILTVTGEVVLGIGVAVFLTLIVYCRVISGAVVLCMFFGTIAVAVALAVFYFWPEYARLFRALTSIR